MPSFTTRIQHAWNAFMNKDPTPPNWVVDSSYYRPDRSRFTRGNERSIVTAVLNRIAMDCAAITIQHVKLDELDRYKETVRDDLNECLTLDANTDQTGRAFMQDVVMSMLDEGCVAIVPVETTINPLKSNSYDINTVRVGKVVQWYPTAVKIQLYNEINGRKTEVTLPKSMVPIIENPLYAVMNEPNSTMNRLMRKLAILDVVDEATGSNKLDLIIQLPYSIRSEGRRNQAEARRKDVEHQLATSKYGIAYIDSTEHITQLNRSLENNLLSQIESLTKLLYSQLGMSEEVMNGTANEEQMNLYYARTIEPIMAAIADEMKRKFLTKTARTQGHSIMFFRDPFKLIPSSELAEIADKFTRNEIMSSNEFRAIIGMKPSDDPNADALRNSNLYQPNLQNGGGEMTDEQINQQLSDLDSADSQLDSLGKELDKY